MKLVELFGITNAVKPFIITGPTDEEIKIMNEEKEKQDEYDNSVKIERLRTESRQREKERELRILRDKVDTEDRLKRFNVRKLHLKELTDIKTEFDLIFISFLDRTTCNSSCNNSGSNTHSKDKIVYSLVVKYPVTSDISTMVKTTTQINEDMLDIEAYTKYINSKSTNRTSIVSLQGDTSNYLLSIEITTIANVIYTDEDYYTRRNSRDYDDWMLVGDNSWMSGLSGYSVQGVGRTDRRGMSNMERFYGGGWRRK